MKLLTLLMLFTTSLLTAQTFTTFHSKVYKLNPRKLRKGFGEHVYEKGVYKEIDWKIEDFDIYGNIKKPFPKVGLTSQFGMIMESTMTIEGNGIYVFKLTSDDGSIVWLGDCKLIDNDKSHGMRTMVDTVYLPKGDYPIKLWYYQAYPPLYGLKFSVHQEFLPGEMVYAYKSRCTPIKINGEVLFKSNSAELSEEGKNELRLALKNYKLTARNAMKIIGHTDNQGTEEANQLLSLNRAAAIRDFLRQELVVGLEFSIEGRGESEPIASNKTFRGRAQNRRVEIYLE